jgi:hypothetical protein
MLVDMPRYLVIEADLRFSIDIETCDSAAVSEPFGEYPLKPLNL